MLVLGLAGVACRTSEPVQLDATTPTSDTDETSETTSTDPCAEEDPGVAPGTGTVPGHIHNVALWGCSDEVVFGTHAGTWRTRSGATELVQLAPEGDFMGLVQDPHEPWRYFGSGHFHDATVGNSGLLESTDGGVTWTSIALEGETDFHQIAPSPDQPGLLVGAYEFAFYVSEDHGRTWEEHAVAPLEVTGLVVTDPEGPVIVFASENGIERRALPGFATELLVDADVSGLARHGEGVAYATAAGGVHLCDLELTACTPATSPVAGDPVVSFLSADDGTTWVVTASSEVWRTADITSGSWDLVASQEGTHTH